MEHICICCSYRIRLSAPDPAERRYRGLCPLVTHNWAMVLAPLGASISCCVLTNPICLPVCLSHRCLCCWVQVFGTRKGRGQADRGGSSARSGANPPLQAPWRSPGLNGVHSHSFIATFGLERLSPCCRAQEEGLGGCRVVCQRRAKYYDNQQSYIKIIIATGGTIKNNLCRQCAME
jgi:hypothetical protein